MRFPARTVLGFSVGSLLAGCAGSAFQTPAPPHQATQAQSLPALPPESTAIATSAAAPPHQTLFVTTNGAVLAFRLSDNGNVAPQFAISGPATGLTNTTGIALAGDGRIAVDNLAFSNPAAAEIFASGAHGNVRPIKTISCGGITVPLGAAFDGGGNLYVASGDDGNDISVFAPAAAGCVSNNRIIAGPSTRLNQPYGIAVDASGAIYASNGSGASVAVFAPGAIGNATPRAFIAGDRTGIGTPAGVALDSARNLYVDDFRANSIMVFAAGANGNAIPARSIVGPHTRLNGPNGIGVDTAGNIYVANYLGNTITVYAPGARGDSTPVRTLSGPHTGLSAPFQLGISN